jgi:Ca-activated chloride channel family protein
MIRFASPWWLFALPLVALLALWLERDLRRRAFLLARLADGALLRRLGAGGDPSLARRRRLAPLAMVFLFLALARPQLGQQATRSQSEAAQIMLVLDVSASMLAADLAPNRLERAKLEIQDLMARMEGDQFGLVLFAGAAFVQCPLTVDTAMVQDFLDLAEPRTISRPGTALAAAVEAALGGFDAQRESQKVIIVFTDGEDPDGDPAEAARLAVAQGARIYTVGFGTATGAAVPELDQNGQVTGNILDEGGRPVLSRPDEALLTRLAAEGQGRFLRAGAVGQAAAALDAQLADLRRDPLAGAGARQPIERFTWPLALAFLLLLAAEWPPARGRDA